MKASPFNISYAKNEWLDQLVWVQCFVVGPLKLYWQVAELNVKWIACSERFVRLMLMSPYLYTCVFIAELTLLTLTGIKAYDVKSADLVNEHEKQYP